MITSHPLAPLGEVATLSAYSRDTFQPTSAIVCRLTSPLISFAYELLRHNVACSVLGRDIGAGLIKIIEHQRAMDLDDLSTKLDMFLISERSRAERERRSVESISDQIACIRVFIDHEPKATITSLTSRITSLFDDSTTSSRLLLLTMHRAKGLEFPTVFILDRQRTLPSPYATQSWQKEQERNLWFVAVTRSQDRLFYINSNNWTP